MAGATAAGAQALDSDGPQTLTGFLRRLRGGSRPVRRALLCWWGGIARRGRRQLRPLRLGTASSPAAAAVAASCLLQRSNAAAQGQLGGRRRPAVGPLGRRPITGPAAVTRTERAPITAASTTGRAAAAEATTVFQPPSLGPPTWVQAARRPASTALTSEAGPSSAASCSAPARANLDRIGSVLAAAQSGRRELLGTRPCPRPSGSQGPESGWRALRRPGRGGRLRVTGGGSSWAATPSGPAAERRRPAGIMTVWAPGCAGQAGRGRAYLRGEQTQTLRNKGGRRRKRNGQARRRRRRRRMGRTRCATTSASAAPPRPWSRRRSSARRACAPPTPSPCRDARRAPRCGTPWEPSPSARPYVV